MTKRAKKAVNITVDIIIGIIVIFVIFLCINVIAQKDKGYIKIFGRAYFVVQSDSMKGDGDDNFKKNDLISVTILSDEEKRELSVGDIITFYDSSISGSATTLNSHRIISINYEGTVNVSYNTKGDNNTAADSDPVVQSAIVGVFHKNLGQIGVVFDWFSSTTGYFVCVVVPSFLIVAYCAFNLYRVIRDNRRAKAVANGQVTEGMTEEEIAEARARERELLKAELKAELEAENAAQAGNSAVETGNAADGGEADGSELPLRGAAEGGAVAGGSESGLQTDEDGSNHATDYSEGE